MNLIEVTKGIQRALAGVAVDGIAGMQTMVAIHRLLQQEGVIAATPVADEQLVRTPGEAPSALNARTLKYIGTLDLSVRVREAFTRFAELAQTTAASYGCEYVMISGYRTREEQAVLYQASQAGGAHAVAPGSSMHNYKIAGDFGCSGRAARSTWMAAHPHNRRRRKRSTTPARSTRRRAS